MEKKAHLSLLTLVLLLLPLVMMSGCIDINSTRKVFFPRDDKDITFEQGTIASVRHNFTGGFGDNVQVLTQEEHFSVDNFYIGEGGADLYVWGQVSFIDDSERQVEYQRVIDVSLYFIDEEDGPVLRAHKTYIAPPMGPKSYAESIDTIEGADEGLWSLRVKGNGTASDSNGVLFYDWFIVTVNGRYSSESYNNNAPHSSRQ